MLFLLSLLFYVKSDATLLLHDLVPFHEIIVSFQDPSSEQIFHQRRFLIDNKSTIPKL